MSGLILPRPDGTFDRTATFWLGADGDLASAQEAGHDKLVAECRAERTLQGRSWYATAYDPRLIPSC